MAEIGYTLSSEEHGPNDLVRYARRAEEAGFDFLTVSDHFHPWTSDQGNAPFVWSTIGGVAQATEEIPLEVGVNCPIMRYHPAIVAQAAATAATMMPGRFGLGVGTGELLNEHVLGDHWPPHHVRLEMLEEALDVIRELWTGEMHSHDGKHYTVENAQLFTLPDERPGIHVSAYGEQTAKAAGRLGDGFWSVGPKGGLVDAFEGAGGEGPRYSQLHACYAQDEDEAVRTAHRNWAFSGLPGELNSQLPTPTHFEQATGMVTERDIRNGSIVTTPDPQTHVENIEKFFDAGFDHLTIHQIGPDQEALFRFYEEEILPEFE